MEQELSYCRYCGRRWPDKDLSNRGVCFHCAKERLLAAVTQLQGKCGPIYEKWARNYIASMQATILRLEKETQDND